MNRYLDRHEAVVVIGLNNDVDFVMQGEGGKQASVLVPSLARGFWSSLPLSWKWFQPNQQARLLFSVNQSLNAIYARDWTLHDHPLLLLNFILMTLPAF